MKVLLIGSGGREHALAYKLKQSKLLTELKVFPGNGGFLESEILPTNSFNLKDKNSVQDFVKKNGFEFVVVGPEEPLVDGIIDWLKEISIPAFGPDAYCAQLEGSKDFAKELMLEFGVPTAKYKTFTDLNRSIEYIQSHPLPVVIKADGLAAGKGVAVCDSHQMGIEFLKEIFVENKFGKSGTKVVIEEFLQGEEASIFALTDGETFQIFPAAQDHKRALNNDEGKNTGGMGAYAPAPIATNVVYEKVKEKIFSPMLEGLKKKNHPYKGLLYAGLMINKEGEPFVVEFNARFGDPETQCLMIILDSDLLELMLATAKGNLQDYSLKFKDGFATVVVLAANGYPDEYKKGFSIKLNQPNTSSTVVFHAGTKLVEGTLVANGGRILGITSFAKTLQESVTLSYQYLNENKIENTFYRTDIARRAL
ncbi:MAG: phosphoribosylamine--glycine ligase [Leptospiraceae bacterium]|nr:phosphoribosylamine--glycine ligase [Leptospiraceae bacterium]